MALTRSAFFKTGSGLKLSVFYPPTGDFAPLQNAMGGTTPRVQRSARGIWRLVHYLKASVHISLFISLRDAVGKSGIYSWLG